MSLLEKRKTEEEEESLEDKTIEELEEELALLQSELARKTVTTKEKFKDKVKSKEKSKEPINEVKQENKEKKKTKEKQKVKKEKKIQKEIPIENEKEDEKSKIKSDQKITEKPKIKLRKKINKEDQLQIEAEFYSCIATLNSVVKNFEEGKLDPPTYKRQLRSLMRDAFKSQLELKEFDYNLEEFLKNEKIIEKFPFAAQKLRFADKTTLEISPLDIAVVSTAQIASMSSDLVSHFITISDYTKLDMAKVNSIIPILDDILLILAKFPAFGMDYWVYKAASQWREKLSLLNPNEILDEDDNNKLEFDVVRWAQDFKRRLQDL
ncbi:MAG: hypothetical protein EU551_01155 [Promethearchaeota archaeon]|nr:MAG: hypothetical protein EU551_01155 [Candidatus Lokiarchaeota archaeon]